jgi:hypothetical protein
MTEIQKNVIRLLSEGLPPSEVARNLNLSKSTVSSVIKSKNIQNIFRLTDNKCDHTYFEKIDTVEKAYLLGFFIADGWIRTDSNRMGISIQQEDKLILSYFKSFSNANISYRNRSTDTQKRKSTATITWTSEKMKEDFGSYNIIPNKTYHTEFEFPFERMDFKYTRDFIRGFLDGDGAVEATQGVLTVTFVSTSEKFLRQLGSLFSTIDPGIGFRIRKSIGKTVDYFTMRLNFKRKNKPEKVLKIYNYLYQDSTIFLDRKKKKFETYLKYRGKLEM